jgi:hypothetical protein
VRCGRCAVEIILWTHSRRRQELAFCSFKERQRRADDARYAPSMKPLRCLLQFHAWRLVYNDEGQRYKTCERCGAYRDFDPRPMIM